METDYEVIIIGGGGAGLTAAIYTARANLKTVLFEKNVCGGQIAITDLVENYPGFPEGVLGPDIAYNMEEQAKKSGAEIQFKAVKKITKNETHFSVDTDGGNVTSKVVVFATGAQARMLNVAGEKELIGKGVSYCATCDGPFFRDKIVAVVGGGDSAIQEGLFLTKFARKVYIIHRRDQLRAGPLLQERLKQNEKITVVWDSVVSEVVGEKVVEKIMLKNVKTSDLSPLEVNGVFVFIGHDPSSELGKGFLDLDEQGYIVTGNKMETSIPGVFACGEVRSGAEWQLVSSCGEGCVAALRAEHYINGY